MLLTKIAGYGIDGCDIFFRHDLSAEKKHELCEQLYKLVKGKAIEVSCLDSFGMVQFLWDVFQFIVWLWSVFCLTNGPLPGLSFSLVACYRNPSKTLFPDSATRAWGQISQ